MFAHYPNTPYIMIELKQNNEAMIAKIIRGNKKEPELLTFPECLENKGVYKQTVGGDLLVVIKTGKDYPVFFGADHFGYIFSHMDYSDNNRKEYRRVGDVEIIIRLTEKG